MKRDGPKALIFDLDGVISNTSGLHMAAWIRAIREYELLNNITSRALFSAPHYETLLSGRSRISGLKNVAASRQWAGVSRTQLEEISKKKNKHFRELVGRVDPKDLLFEDAMSFISANLHADIRLALCSSSKNARYILNRAGGLVSFDVLVDGNFVEAQKLAAKPSPEPFAKCMELLNVSRDQAIIFEDAEAGLISALAARARIVVFVNRAHLAPDRIKKISREWLQEDTDLIVVQSFYELKAYEDKLCIA